MDKLKNSKSKKKSSKTKSKSLSKKIIHSTKKSSSNVFKIPRESHELNHDYNFRIAFIKELIDSNKVTKNVSNIPYLSSISFVHLYKTFYGMTYPISIENEYKKLIS